VNVDQGNDRLTLQSCTQAQQIVMGLFLIGIGAALGVLVAWLFRSQPLAESGLLGTGCLAVLFAGLALFSIFLLGGGAYLMLSRPDVFTFDRATGDLAVLRRTILSLKKEKYPLSDIEAVVLRAETSIEHNATCYYVDLVMRSRALDDSRKDRRLRITGSAFPKQGSERAKAEMVATFLGLPVQEEAHSS
jgi:hypothetical protein